MNFDWDYFVELSRLYLPQAIQLVLMALGALVVAGYAYVKATPTQDDDQWLMKMENTLVIGWLLRVLVAFSPKRRLDDPEVIVVAPPSPPRE